jgi:hypothetical protein
VKRRRTTSPRPAKRGTAVRPSPSGIVRQRPRAQADQPLLLDLQEQVGALTRELAEARKRLVDALEQQTATSEVLRVISSSPGELALVFAAMLANAVRICDAEFGVVYRCEGDVMRSVAMHNVPSALAALGRDLVFRLIHLHPTARLARV